MNTLSGRSRWSCRRTRVPRGWSAGAVVRLELDEEVAAVLRAMGVRHGVVPSTTLLAG